MCILHHAALGTQTASDDDLAILGQRLADGIQRLFHRRIDKTAGVDHDEIGILVTAGDFVTFGAKLGENALGIRRRLGTAERNETDLGNVFGHVRLILPTKNSCKTPERWECKAQIAAKTGVYKQVNEDFGCALQHGNHERSVLHTSQCISLLLPGYMLP